MFSYFAYCSERRLGFQNSVATSTVSSIIIALLITVASLKLGSTASLLMVLPFGIDALIGLKGGMEKRIYLAEEFSGEYT